MRKAKLFMMLALLVMGVSSMFAQNVTISPKTGSLVASLSESGETGFENGLSCLWRHEQLPLSFTSSDEDDLTESGELAKPKASFGIYNDNLVIVGGHRQTYLTVTLPKGYRITGYKIVLANDLIGAAISTNTGYNNLNSNSGYMRFYEVEPWETDGTEIGAAYYNNAEPQGSDVIAQAVADDGDTDITAGTGSADSGKEYTIQRTSLTDTDMGNQLYFRLTKTYFYYGLTIKSFEIWFTAEGTFEADVAPEEIGTARSVVTAPFQTSKIDIGQLTQQTQEDTGATFFCYDYNNVTDLTAYTYLYQDDAVQDGVPTEGEEEKHIYPVKVDGQELYAFNNDTYFIETPIQVHTQSGLEAPIGYRIVGARFNYLWGTETPAGTLTVRTCRITATRNNTTYYLNDQLQFTTNDFFWYYDSDDRCPYVGSGSNKRYLSCTGSGNSRTLTLSSNPPSTDSSNPGYYDLIVFTRNGSTYYVGWDNDTAENRYYLRYYRNGNTWTIAVIRNNTTNAATASVVDAEEISRPAFSPGNYTLNVYDKTGTTVELTKDVTEENAGGILELDGLNNDAVKFEIANLEEGKQALVSVTLLMQSLNPYINYMDIVCHDPDDQLQLAQSFHADDFTVSGGKFIFYIPEDYKDTELTFTFSDLYSTYGDETYPEGSSEHFGRYCFVTSDYFVPINGNGNGGLYDSAYDPNADATSKIFTSTAGNIRWKFNNAEDLGNTGTGNGYLEEYPFTVANYLGSEDPDDSGEVGAFIDCKLKASDETQKSGIYYVFTADETRYNIAPTTAWQHRYYAFYRMDIELVAKSYTPDLTWTKIYDETFYTDDSNATQSKSMWGLTLNTKDPDTGEEVTGYLSVKEILEAIDERTADDVNAPKDLDQILYIDGSELYSIINSADKTLADLKTSLGTNALVFLPENTTSTLDNFAYKTVSGSFRAGKDIVIADKRPFFSPYDIQVDAANYAKYDREITYSGYDPITHATIVLPFTIYVNEQGVHENDDNEGTPFTLSTMNSNNSLSVKEGSKYDYYADAYFTKITGNSEANRPYIVTLQTAGEDSFKAHTKGSLVRATTDDGVFKDEATTGTFEDANYSFTNTGTFTGKEIADASTASETVFYFGNNYFLDSKTLTSGKSLKILPFRAFYDYKAGAGAKMTSFRIVFGENENSGTTGINEVQKDADLAVVPGKGVITLMARADKDVTIHAVSGITVDKCNLRAGDTRTVAVPAGVYVINGVKMVVK